jgi:hypothetical protein
MNDSELHRTALVGFPAGDRPAGRERLTEGCDIIRPCVGCRGAGQH